MIDTLSKIEKVPFVFRMPDHNEYPKGNTPDAECWFSQNIKTQDIKGERIYLNVLWTSFYKNNCNYGNDKRALRILQEWLGRLDTSKKYFTIIGWDDGIINDISHLDIKVFSMAGGIKDYGLPLICQSHKISFNVERDIFASFTGRITHPLRHQMIEALKGKNGYYISTQHHEIPSYCSVMARSVFTLAPRGYSATSFRIMEALEMGSIPVYVSDIFYEPHGVDFDTYGVKIPLSQIKDIDKILRSISEEEIKRKQGVLKGFFDKYYTFESNKKLILENL